MVVGIVFAVQGLRNLTVRLKYRMSGSKARHKALCILELQDESGEDAGMRILRQVAEKLRRN